MTAPDTGAVTRTEAADRAAELLDSRDPSFRRTSTSVHADLVEPLLDPGITDGPGRLIDRLEVTMARRGIGASTPTRPRERR